VNSKEQELRNAQARLGWVGTQALAVKSLLTVSLVCEGHMGGCPRETAWID